MSTFANGHLGPGILVAWAAAGLAAAYLAWSVMNGGRTRLIGDTLAGVFGGIIGGLAFSLLVADAAQLGGVGAALLGAWAAVLVARAAALWRRPEPPGSGGRRD
jgi:hypothetical protein